ncbi:hypothetical protein BGZ72_010343, partial [Mortierella alpina]
MAPNRVQRKSGTAKRKSHDTCCTLLLAIFFILLPSQGTDAYDPTVVWGMASNFIEGRFMLVHGGTSSSSSPSVWQTFKLNLDTNWNTSQPDVVQLRDGSRGHNFASTLSSDNKIWFMVANSAPHKFYIGNGTWNDFEFSQPLTNKTGLRAATDPASGMIYVINGLSTNGSYSMLQYNIATDTSSSIPMDPRM